VNRRIERERAHEPDRKAGDGTGSGHQRILVRFAPLCMPHRGIHHAAAPTSVKKPPSPARRSGRGDDQNILDALEPSPWTHNPTIAEKRSLSSHASSTASPSSW